MNKVVFLDRDGTIAKDVPYCSRPEDFMLLPTVGEGIRLLSRGGFKVIVITNQSGVARGYFTEEMLKKIHEKMKTDISALGASIDAIYYCPHHPDDHCRCRKPRTGLLEQAIHDWNIDISQSYFIGDKFLDMEAANNIRCKAVLVPNSEPELSSLKGRIGSKVKIDFVCSEFYAAASWVMSEANH